ncbi:MAG: hypothetical protein LBS17_04370 [Actinomycetes bacterium]|jgi:hypothetical protein|nr:hypothetical protein [Actinomycetes bacterium]
MRAILAQKRTRTITAIRQTRAAILLLVTVVAAVLGVFLPLQAQQALAAGGDPNWTPGPREFYATTGGDSNASTDLGYAMKNASRYDTIYLGADIQITSQPDAPMAPDQTLVICGRDPKTGVRHTLSSNGNNYCIRSTTGSDDTSRTIEFTDVNMRVDSVYCFVYTWAAYSNVTLRYIDVDYAGQQGWFNPNGRVILGGNTKFEITTESNETNYIRVLPHSNVTLIDKSVYASFFCQNHIDGVARGLYVDHDAVLNWTHTDGGASEIFANYGFGDERNSAPGNEVPIVVGPRAKLHFTVAYGLTSTDLRDDAVIPITVQEDGELTVTQTKGGHWTSGGLVELHGDFTVQRGARVWFEMPWAGSLFYVGSADNAKYRVLLDDPRSFGYRAGYATTGTVRDFALFYNYEKPAQAKAVTFLDSVAHDIWYYTGSARPYTGWPYANPDMHFTGDGTTTTLQLTKAAGTDLKSSGNLLVSGQTGLTLTSNDSALTGAAPNTYGQKHIMSWGNLEAKLTTPVTTADTTLTGTATPGATVTLVFYDDGATERWSAQADAAGNWAIGLPDPIASRTEIDLAVELDWRWINREHYTMVQGYPTAQITYDDESCASCHTGSLIDEHLGIGDRDAMCGICHNKKYTPADATRQVTDWHTLRVQRLTCGLDESGCHARDAAAGQVWHGYRPAAVSTAHALRGSGTTAVSACSGTAASPCHRLNSHTSLFWFGEMDLASVHADYQTAIEQQVTQSASTPSAAFAQQPDGCGTCHMQTTDPANPRRLKPAVASAVDSAGALTCADCHQGANGQVYAGANPCYRGGLPDGNGQTTPLKVLQTQAAVRTQAQASDAQTDTPLGQILDQLEPETRTAITPQPSVSATETLQPQVLQSHPGIGVMDRWLFTTTPNFTGNPL